MPASTQLNSNLELDNAFWDFSVSFWNDEKARQALLQLQDQNGLRINLILLACWLGLRKQDFESVIPALTRENEIAWQQDYVAPLRQLRQQLPKTALLDVLKSRLQAAELEAEKIEHAILYELARLNARAVHGKNTLQVLSANLAGCYRYQTDSNMNLPATQLREIVSACLPSHSKDRISELFKELTS